MSAVRHRLAGPAVLLAAVLTVAAMGGLALVWQQGYRLYIVHTGSMEPGLRPGDAVLDAPVSGPVRPGQVVTFAVASGPDSVVTHRVVSVDGGLIHTQGDANRSPDSWVLHRDRLRGLPVATLPRAGYALVYLQQPAGLGSIITAVLGLTLLWRVFFPGPEGAPVPARAPAGVRATRLRRSVRRVALRGTPG